MSEVLSILIATLTVFGFYCLLAELKDYLLHRKQKRNNCTKKPPAPFDKDA